MGNFWGAFFCCCFCPPSNHVAFIFFKRHKANGDRKNRERERERECRIGEEKDREGQSERKNTHSFRFFFFVSLFSLFSLFASYKKIQGPHGNILTRHTARPASSSSFQISIKLERKSKIKTTKSQHQQYDKNDNNVAHFFFFFSIFYFSSFQRECPRRRCDPLAATRCMSVSSDTYDSATPGRRPSGFPPEYPRK